MARKHPSFRFPFADPLAMQPIDFADTADHLGESAAARMSATIAQGIRRHLTLPAEHAPTETPR
jgi:hypothetical protein